MNTFRILPISPDYVDRVRTRGTDDFGNPIVVRVAEQGAPLRCCLRDAEAGEKVALIAYRPSSIGGPYAEVGINALLANPEVSFLHSRNVLAGCWMFAIDRGPA